MAGRILMTLDVCEVVRRLRAGETDRAIARALSVARKTVGRYRDRAQAEGWLAGELPSTLDLELRLKVMVLKCALPRQPFKAEDHKARIEALIDTGVQSRAIFQRLRDDHKFRGSYSSVYRYVKSLRPGTPEGFVRIEVDPGDEAQVDFGSAGEQVDPKTGEVKKAYVFVMTLSHSRHQYAVIVFDQKVRTWLRCHREAFDYIGGVSRKIVIDNLKAAIVRAVLHDVAVQRSYREFAEHYGFLISPCRPRTARGSLGECGRWARSSVCFGLSCTSTRVVKGPGKRSPSRECASIVSSPAVKVTASMAGSIATVGTMGDSMNGWVP